MIGKIIRRPLASSWFALLFTLGMACCVAAGSATETTNPFRPPKIPVPIFKPAQFNVRDFGAIGSRLTNDTPAISPIYMLITDRLRSGDPNKKIGMIKNIKISNVVVTGCAPGRQGPVHPCTISGRPESRLENIVLENIKIQYASE